MRCGVMQTCLEFIAINTGIGVKLRKAPCFKFDHLPVVGISLLFLFAINRMCA